MNEFFRNFTENLGPWFYSHGIKIILIIIGAYLIRKFSGIFIDKIIRKAIVSNNFLSGEAEKKREDTLIKVFEGALRVIIWLAAVLMIVSEFGINIGPLLAGVGVIGLAVGFGSQYVLRDFFTGLFIILENQYRVGDMICVGKVCGMVESINLRVTVLRDTDGIIYYVPNGEIKIVSNKTK
ncbi:MAG: mechanosensitive ion channel domain-containing protein [Patescibacteria group bacterium]